MTGIGSHTRPNRGDTDDWITPQWILDALGGWQDFELDPCAAIEQPWPTAKTMWTIRYNGLVHKWRGRVWLNPPYGRQAAVWLQRLLAHGTGTALVFARTETAMFHDLVCPHASALLFLRGRIRFCRPDGSPGRWTGGGPSVLVAYGAYDAKRLRAAHLEGAFVPLK